ncbi:MAG: DUF1294 domain-containing protein [Planctomycetes bacterium]|nr:DUF1294 domain-containing protein [Planctomycetota bacterium]
MQFLLGLAAALNVVSFFVYGWDKRQARLDRRRIPEKHLLLLLLIGGWVGGWSGMQVFRHKTRKASFLLRAILATLPWLVVGGLVIRSALAGEGSG